MTYHQSTAIANDASLSLGPAARKTPMKIQSSPVPVAHEPLLSKTSNISSHLPSVPSAAHLSRGSCALMTPLGQVLKASNTNSNVLATLALDADKDALSNNILPSSIQLEAQDLPGGKGVAQLPDRVARFNPVQNLQLYNQDATRPAKRRRLFESHQIAAAGRSSVVRMPACLISGPTVLSDLN